MAKVIKVYGPPGTGKTTYLTGRVEEAAEKFGGGAVVVASLTRAAAAEVAGRKTKIPPKNIGTLHSHAYQALKRPVIAETTEGLKAWNAWCPTPSLRIDLKHAVDPENAQAEPMPMDSDGAVLLNEANILRQQMVDPQFWPPRVQRFWHKWTEWKAESRYMDFTDLIEQCIAQEIPMPQAPAVLMVDEAQDMSRLEFTLATMWGDKCAWMMVVGDPDQNLYEWRGSSPEAFAGLQAVDERVLEQSYRVPREIHAEAVKWVEQIPDRPPVAYQPRDWNGVVRRAQHTWQDPTSLITDAMEDAERYTGWGHEWPAVMILATCNYMLQPVVMELRKQGIPFYNPYRLKAGNWNPLRGGARLLAFVKPQAPRDGGEASLWTWKDLHRWIEPLQAKGVLVRGVKSHIEGKCAQGRFGASDTQADTIVPVQQVVEMFLSDEHKDAVLNGNIDWWEENLKHEDRKRQSYALTVARRRGFDALRTRPAVCVGTIHSVKGGQADCVYLLPDLSTVAFFEQWSKGVRAPIIRQFYVGMTRAREELVLCAPSGATTIAWR